MKRRDVTCSSARCNARLGEAARVKLTRHVSLTRDIPGGARCRRAWAPASCAVETLSPLPEDDDTAAAPAPGSALIVIESALGLAGRRRFFDSGRALASRREVTLTDSIPPALS